MVHQQGGRKKATTVNRKKENDESNHPHQNDPRVYGY